MKMSNTASLPVKILKFLPIFILSNFSNYSFSYGVDTESLICSFNMIYSGSYDVNYQPKMNDLVRKIPNRTFPVSDFRGKEPLNLTKILNCSHHILQALDY